MRILTKKRLQDYWERNPRSEQPLKRWHDYVRNAELTQQLSDPITIRPIKNDANYEHALSELDRMIGNVEPGTPDGNRYELLASMVEVYEGNHYEIEPSDDPIAMIEFVLEARGLSRKDLEPFIETRQRVWDIMGCINCPSCAMG